MYQTTCNWGKTCFKKSEEEVKQFKTEIQNKLEAEFLMSKMFFYNIPHFYIIWKILNNPMVGRPIVAGYT